MLFPYFCWKWDQPARRNFLYFHFLFSNRGNMKKARFSLRLDSAIILPPLGSCSQVCLILHQPLSCLKNQKKEFRIKLNRDSCACGCPCLRQTGCWKVSRQSVFPWYIRHFKEIEMEPHSIDDLVIVQMWPTGVKSEIKMLGKESQ